VTSFRDLIERFLENAVLTLMAGLALLVVVAVAFRKAGAPLVWYDEVAPILLAWLTYYGGALAALKHAHIGFPKLAAAAPRKLRLVLIAVRETFVVGFFALAAWAGWRVMLVLDDTYLVSLPWMPARVTQSVIPIGAVLFIVAELVAVVERLEREREASAQ
jgi:TRAP-type C4-dicarboxylate transport system permease small subunit